jgi:hypothetical protein
MPFRLLSFPHGRAKLPLSHFWQGVPRLRDARRHFNPFDTAPERGSMSRSNYRISTCFNFSMGIYPDEAAAGHRPALRYWMFLSQKPCKGERY